MCCQLVIARLACHYNTLVQIWPSEKALGVVSCIELHSVDTAHVPLYPSVAGRPVMLVRFTGKPGYNEVQKSSQSIHYSHFFTTAKFIIARVACTSN